MYEITNLFINVDLIRTTAKVCQEGASKKFHRTFYVKINEWKMKQKIDKNKSLIMSNNKQISKEKYEKF